MDIKIFIESTWKGPARRDGVAMWLIEWQQEGIPITRQGFIHQEDGTETQGNLKAIINAFFVVKNLRIEKPSALVFTQCESILHTVQNYWHTQWEKNDWHNAKGKEVKNKELWKMFSEITRPVAYAMTSGHHEYTNIMQQELEKEVKQWKHK